LFVLQEESSKAQTPWLLKILPIAHFKQIDPFQAEQYGLVFV
jgi:hypothetical protein